MVFLRTVDATDADVVSFVVVQNFESIAIEDGNDEASPPRASIIELFKPTLYCLTPVRIAPRVIVRGVKLR